MQKNLLVLLAKFILYTTAVKRTPVNNEIDPYIVFWLKNFFIKKLIFELKTATYNIIKKKVINLLTPTSTITCTKKSATRHLSTILIAVHTYSFITLSATIYIILTIAIRIKCYKWLNHDI